MTAPIRSMPDPDAILATVRNQDDLVDAFRTIKAMLGMTNAQCDDLANLTDGHTDKLLGPTQTKSISPLTFNALCWAFAVKFEMKIDLEQAAIMAEHWEDRQRKRPPEYSENGRVSKKLLEKAKPLVAQAMGRAGAAKKMIMLSAEHRSAIASKAAKSRWKKHRREKRSKAAPIVADATS